MKEIVAFFADRPELLTLVLILAEITLIGGIALAVCRIWRNDAAARYGVAFTALVLIWLVVPATLVLRAGGYSTVEVSRTLYTNPAPALTAAELSEIAKLPLSALEPAPAVYQVPWWVYLWVAGTAAILIRFAVGFWRVRRLRKQAAPLPHLKGAAPVFLTEEVAGPVVVGALRPSVLIPSSILDGLSETELHDVLAHEFAHVARRHLLVAILQRLTVALFWPHPFVHLLSRHLVEAREEICDNVVLRSAGRARYARVLLRVAECRQASGHFSASLGLFGPDSNLEERVKSLLDPHRRISTEMNYPRIALVALMLVSGAAALAGARVQTELVAAPIIWDGAQLPPTHQVSKPSKQTSAQKKRAEAERQRAAIVRKVRADIERQMNSAQRDKELATARAMIEKARQKMRLDERAVRAAQESSADRARADKQRVDVEIRAREIAREKGQTGERVRALVEQEMRNAKLDRDQAGALEKIARERALIDQRAQERAVAGAIDRVKIEQERALRDRAKSDDVRATLDQVLAQRGRANQDDTAALKARIAAQEKEIDRLKELLKKLQESKRTGGGADRVPVLSDIPVMGPLFRKGDDRHLSTLLQDRTSSRLTTDHVRSLLSTSRLQDTARTRLTTDRLQGLFRNHLTTSSRLHRDLFQRSKKRIVVPPKKEERKPLWDDPFGVGDRPAGA